MIVIARCRRPTPEELSQRREPLRRGGGEGRHRGYLVRGCAAGGGCFTAARLFGGRLPRSGRWRRASEGGHGKQSNRVQVGGPATRVRAYLMYLRVGGKKVGGVGLLEGGREQDSNPLAAEAKGKKTRRGSRPDAARRCVGPCKGADFDKQGRSPGETHARRTRQRGRGTVTC